MLSLRRSYGFLRKIKDRGQNCGLFLTLKLTFRKLFGKRGGQRKLGLFSSFHFRTLSREYLYLSPFNAEMSPWWCLNKQYLLQRGANLNETDVGKRTALHWAAQYGRAKVRELGCVDKEEQIGV